MTGFSKRISNLLVPQITAREKVVDLFAGCGGLSLGFEAAGFVTHGFEMVSSAVQTYRRNLKGLCTEARLEVGFDYPPADVVIGGPPCQPFSVRGKQQGMKDARDGFPIFIDAVKRLNPRLFLFENVRNLMFSHRWYLDLILDELGNLVTPLSSVASTLSTSGFRKIVSGLLLWGIAPPSVSQILNGKL